MIERAKEILENGGHACVLMRGDMVLTSGRHGVHQLLEWDLGDAYIADKVVGKAAASIMICGGVREVYATIMSKAAIDLLAEYGVKFSFGREVEAIRRRDGTGICPMEQTCLGLKTAEECDQILRA